MQTFRGIPIKDNRKSRIKYNALII